MSVSLLKSPFTAAAPRKSNVAPALESSARFMRRENGPRDRDRVITRSTDAVYSWSDSLDVIIIGEPPLAATDHPANPPCAYTTLLRSTPCVCLLWR